MTSIEALNQLADETPDSKYTGPGETLFFSSCSTIGESLKKLKSHNFILGYVYDIEVNNQMFTRITAYNQKNDIVLAWMGPDQDEEVKFPTRHPSYQSFLYLVRYKKGAKTEVGVSKERLTSKLCDGKKQVDSEIPHIVDISNPAWFGDYWPILEHPEIEEQKRKKILESNQVNHCDRTFYQGVATLCNIYRFDDTYQALDPGLQSIYQTLYQHREEIFCRDVERRSVVDGTIPEMLDMLDMEYSELEDIFTKQGLIAPPLNNTEFTEVDEKISFIKQWTGRIKQSIGGRQKTIMPSRTSNPIETIMGPQ